jgi:hypothetical protein
MILGKEKKKKQNKNYNLKKIKFNQHSLQLSYPQQPC